MYPQQIRSTIFRDKLLGKRHPVTSAPPYWSHSHTYAIPSAIPLLNPCARMSIPAVADIFSQRARRNHGLSPANVDNADHYLVRLCR